VPTILPGITLPMPTAGVRRDLSRRLVPPNSLAEGENWILYRGNFQVRPGLTAFADLNAERPLGLIQYNRTGEANCIVKGTSKGWWRLNATTKVWVDICGTGGALSGGTTAFVMFRVMNKGGTDYLLGVNGVNVGKKWDGSAVSYAAITGTPPATPKALAVCFNRAIMLDGQTLYHSAYNDFDAGWQTTLVKALIDTPGLAVGLLEMGNTQYAVYKTDAIYMGIAPGPGTYPFSFALRATGIAGPVSPAAIVALPDNTHAYLGRDGQVYVFNGMNPVAMGSSVREAIVQVADIPGLTLSFGWFDGATSTLWFAFPQVGYTDCNLAIALSWPGLAVWPQRWTNKRSTIAKEVYEASNTTWGEALGTWGASPLTWGQTTRLQPRVLVGEHDGQIYELMGSADGTVLVNQAPVADAIPAYFETGLMDGGDPTRFKTVVEVDELLIAGAAQVVNVKLGMSNYGEDRVLTPASALNITSSSVPAQARFRASARAFSHRVETSATVPIVFQGATIQLRRRGKR